MIELNERQRDILMKEGIDIENGLLTYTQQEAINTIEEMLQVLEQKYNQTFLYRGFCTKGTLDNDRLYASPCTEESDSLIIFVEKMIENDQVIYVDNYMDLQIRKPFNFFLGEFAKKELQTDAVKVYSDVKTKLEAIPNDLQELKGTVTGATLFFVDGSLVSVEDMEKFVLTCERWMRQNEFFGLTQIILLKEERFLYVTDYNYTEYLQEKNYIRRERLWIK